MSHLDRPTELAHREREVGGEYQWRREGEIHLFNPRTVFKLQHATRAKRYEVFKEYTKAVDDQSARLATLRGLMRLKSGLLARRSRSTRWSRSPRSCARFSTGAMSYGSISAEAHETLAIAMNRLGGRSNTGEGGEDPDRFTPDAERRPPTQRHQAGGLGPLRGDLGVPGQRRRHPDQDRPGGQAGRRGPAPRGQDLSLDRQDPLLDARGRADLAAAAPRHLLDRGHRPAHPRPEVGQSPGPGAREAGGRGGCGDGRRRGGQGPLRRGADLGPRRGDRGGAAHLAEARGRSPGSWGWPRPSRPWWPTTCGTASSSRSTGR